MLTYYTSGSNYWTLRTSPIISASIAPLTVEYQDMFLLTNQSQSIAAIESTYDEYESLLTFSASISGAVVGNEYRATIKSGSCSVWHGSVQVYNSQSVFSKSDYENQNKQYISNVTDNSYIIMN